MCNSSKRRALPRKVVGRIGNLIGYREEGQKLIFTFDPGRSRLSYNELGYYKNGMIELRMEGSVQRCFTIHGVWGGYSRHFSRIVYELIADVESTLVRHGSTIPKNIVYLIRAGFKPERCEILLHPSMDYVLTRERVA